MSAPRTNIEKQEKRHWGPLSGMALAVIFACALLLSLGAWVFYEGNNPGEEAETPAESSPALSPPATTTGD